MKYRGVTRNRQQTRYMARIRHKKRLIHIGTYDTPQEAARAYDETAKRLHGSKAVLNFEPYRRLTSKQIQIYMLCSYKFGGMTYKAAAQQLGVSVGTIQDTLKKAKKKCPELFPIRFRKAGRQQFEDWMSNKVMVKF